MAEYGKEIQAHLIQLGMDAGQGDSWWSSCAGRDYETRAMKGSTMSDVNRDESSHVVTRNQVRGRAEFVAVALLVIAILGGSCGIGVMRWNHVAHTPETQKVVSYMVRPGDTLWSCAQRVTPRGENVSQTVDRLMQLNDLDSASLNPGQRLVVPAE